MQIFNLKIILFLSILTVLSSCEGSMGCSGCSGCGLQMEPIPGDFPTSKRVKNATQIHVSSTTFDFLENNWDKLLQTFFPDGLSFEIPPSSQDVSLIGRVDICPEGGCQANLTVTNISITPVPPSTIRAVLQVEVEVRNLSVIIHQGIACLCWDTCDCSVDFVTRNSGRPYNSFLADLVFEIDSNTEYTYVSIQNARIVDDIENDDLNITNTNFCGLAICNLAKVGFIKDFLIDQIQQSLSEQLNSINDNFCRKCTESCPPSSSCDSSNPEEGVCRYGDGTCVPTLLGIMGKMDIGGLLSSLSPSTQATMDVLFAAGGYAEAKAEPDSLDLGFYAGAQGDPVSQCVRTAPIPCETNSDCPPPSTCGSPEWSTPWILPCRRCVDSCPEGSSPRDGLPCQPDPDNPLLEYDPSQPCMLEDGSCVPINYCEDGDGNPVPSQEPSEVLVPVAESLKTSSFTHCVFCTSNENCSDPYDCNMYGVCADSSGKCQETTESVMIVAGMSESMIKRYLYGAVSSGALCLEIPPGAIPQLSTQTLVLAIRPLENLVWDNSPVALVLKPSIAKFNIQKPYLDAFDSPDVAIEDSPLLSISLRDLSIDFYAWIDETYSRFMTATFDITLNLDFDVKNNQITPIIRNPVVQDVRVYNKNLLAVDEGSLRTLVGGLIELAMGFIPGLEPIEIPALDPLSINIPDGGIGHIKENGEDFLVLYANLALSESPPSPPPPPLPLHVETDLKVIESFNPPVDLSTGTAKQFSSCESKPYFVIQMKGLYPGATDSPMEYRWRLNGGPWSRWSRKETERIESLSFVFQGRHILEAQARVAGKPETIDTEPAKVELLVDGVPPEINIAQENSSTLLITAEDIVSKTDKIKLLIKKISLDGTIQETKETIPPLRIKTDDMNLWEIEITATDEAGNTSTRVFEIRGRLPEPPPDSSGCGSCALSENSEKAKLSPSIVMVFAIFSVFLIRRKRNLLKNMLNLFFLLLFSLVFLFLTTACSCEEESNGVCGGKPGPECCLTSDDCGENTFCCTVNHKCMSPPSPLQSPPAPKSLEGWFNEGCQPGFFCQDMPSFITGETEEEGCSFDWSCCKEASKLSSGSLGKYLGMDVKVEGENPVVWISGYSPGMSKNQIFGDLVAGRWNFETSEVQWEIIDGVPENGFVSNSTEGWRGGISDPGDDVGMYTSLLLDENESPMISYYDKTHGSLKFAKGTISGESVSWAIETVDDGTRGHTPAPQAGDAGQYTEMTFSPSKNPVILYRGVTFEPKNHPGVSGYQVVHINTHLKSAEMTGEGQWNIKVIASRNDTPCWSGSCPEGYVCRTEDRLCWPPSSVSEHQSECEACTDTQACLQKLDSNGAGTGAWGCEDIITSPTDLPEGTGIWTSSALNGSNIEAVFYDRTGGNLVWVFQEEGAWQEPVILDGDEESPNPDDHGDRGWYPSIAIDSNGTRHIVYVDGLAESLIYMQVDSSKTVVLKETIDDGIDTTNMEHDLVGDNTSIGIDSDGNLRVVYQNSSDGTLIMAIRDTTGAWSKELIPQTISGFVGYYSLQRIYENNSYIAYFYYNNISPPTGSGVDLLICTLSSGLLNCQ